MKFSYIPKNYIINHVKYMVSIYIYLIKSSQLQPYNYENFFNYEV